MNMTQRDTVVSTKYGMISGLWHEGKYENIRSYRGIPYAKPPVGDLRWAPPVDPDKWDGIKECVNFASVCVQPTSGMLEEPWGTDFYYAGVPPMDEDCLYLNVTTGSVKEDEKRPVFIWLHGGGSDHGFSYEAEFNPEELAYKGIVVVSVGHRLSAFGYMALPQITEIYGKSGNYILMDNMKALEWVIGNISAFGGDPDNITIGGQSAGCAKAMTLALSSVARGHVKRVINDSSLCWSRNIKTQEEAHAEWRKYLSEIGINPDVSLEELRSIPAGNFIPKQKKHIPGNLVFDGDVVPDLKLEDSVDLYGKELDFMAGVNLGEIAICPDKTRTQIGFTKAVDFYDYSREILGDLYEKYDFPELVKVSDDNVDRESRRVAAFGLHLGDKMGNLAVNRRFSHYRENTVHGGRTYTYLFSRVLPSREEEEGTPRDSKRLLSWHSSELWYNFASMRENVPPARPWKETDFRLADQMSSYWANFIKNGDPNGEGLPQWEEGVAGYMELCEDSHMMSMDTPLHDMIEEFLKPYNVFPR